MIASCARPNASRTSPAARAARPEVASVPVTRTASTSIPISPTLTGISWLAATTPHPHVRPGKQHSPGRPFHFKHDHSPVNPAASPPDYNPPRARTMAPCSQRKGRPQEPRAATGPADQPDHEGAEADREPGPTLPATPGRTCPARPRLTRDAAMSAAGYPRSGTPRCPDAGRGRSLAGPPSGRQARPASSLRRPCPGARRTPRGSAGRRPDARAAVRSRSASDARVLLSLAIAILSCDRPVPARPPAARRQPASPAAHLVGIARVVIQDRVRRVSQRA